MELWLKTSVMDLLGLLDVPKAVGRLVGMRSRSRLKLTARVKEGSRARPNMGRKMILDCWNQRILYRRDCFFSPTTYQEVTTLAHDKGLELFTISDIHSRTGVTRQD